MKQVTIFYLCSKLDFTRLMCELSYYEIDYFRRVFFHQVNRVQYFDYFFCLGTMMAMFYSRDRKKADDIKLLIWKVARE